MFLSHIALAHTEFGVSHFTTDLILVLSFAVVTALPMSLLRPQIQEKDVKSSTFQWFLFTRKEVKSLISIIRLLLGLSTLSWLFLPPISRLKLLSKYKKKAGYDY